MTKTELSEEFLQRFNKIPTYTFFCPGRVNLIGEHIDYNGGKVMPFAISLGTFVAVAKNKENVFRFQCINFPETAELPVQSSYSKTGKEWFNYPLGVINEFIQNGNAIGGLDMLYYGNLPIGAGVSSSASIEVLTGFMLSRLFDIRISLKEIALLAKKVENEFIGLSCGIMDMFAVAMGQKNNAILLDCDTVEHAYIPFDAGEYVPVIINSKKQRSLAESKYNERYGECMEALRLLQQELPINNLCEASLSDFEKHKHLLANEVIEKRALHVISENERVREARDVLEAGNISRLGELLYASHASLQELYEVSGKELDTIVEFAKTFPACIGARMTGAGFGGCAIALVKKDQVADFEQQLVTFYTNKIGYAPEVIASAIGDGVREV
jgi:galactokinase